MSYATEPTFQHGSAPRVGVLLVNLGTPDAPQTDAVRRYLAEFLSDPRVVEIPRALWLPILHGIILRVRPAKSAAKYASVWTPEGSPLAVWTRKQATLLQGYLGERGEQVVVSWAMRYGRPDMAGALDQLKQQGCDRILVLPMYPQYSGTTTASVWDGLSDWCATQRNLPEIRFVKQHHDDAAYIDALAARVTEFWQREGRGDHLLLSFHGVPERTLHLGDPYHCQCLKTGRLLRERLGLNKDQMSLSFQSRFGKAKWLEPYTEATLKALAKRGVKHLQVFCPGFPADCLETLEEIAIEGRHDFLQAGGQRYDHIPCLNDHPAWIRALVDIVQRHVAGWPTRREQQPRPAELEGQRLQALAMGAKA
ncbi:ferrochelatase [Leptothrix discophora]|uniref:Ferrochelatase n=1 Tax=Leptothrix discophora TaxID=89 RepID=A0ABT9FYB0_LEPDI|nr:ferrochelatase [Leptothrix discophora]MDP4299227.1 ferrochelatase [Leptothrix discophora]